MKISIADINHRESNMIPKFSNVYESTSNITNQEFVNMETSIKRIHNWNKLNQDTNKAYECALEEFINLSLQENTPTSLINKEYLFLLENVDKPRSAQQLARSIKYRNSRLKSKIQTKINNKLDVTSNIQNSIANLQKTLGQAGTGITAGVAKSTDVDDVKENKNEAALFAALNSLEEEANKYAECDRIIRNYNALSKVFNFDKMVLEMVNDHDIYPTAYNISACIDTSTAPFKNKFNTSLETCYYVFNKHHINSKNIYEAVLDYYFLSGGINESTYNDFIDVMNNNIIDEEFDITMSISSEDETSIGSVNYDSFDSNFGPIEEKGLQKAINNKKKELKKSVRKNIKDVKLLKRGLKKAAKEGNPEEHRDEDVKKMVEDFRKDIMKEKDEKGNVQHFRTFLNNFFAKTPYQIVYELPNMFGIIRAGFIISVTAINPIIGLVTLITDQIIKIALTRKQLRKCIVAYDKEIDAVTAKIEKTKDQDTKDRYNRYKEELIKEVKKLREYENNIYSDEENDERDDVYKSYDGDDDDFDFDFGDDDWDDDWDDLKESAIRDIASVIVIENLMTDLNQKLISDNIDGIACNNIFKLSNDSIDAMVDFSSTVPTIINRDSIKESLIDERDNLRHKQNKLMGDYIRIDVLSENINKINNQSRIYGVTTNSLKGNIYMLKSLLEISKLNSSVMLEMDLANTLKLAMKNLKRDAMKLSDKEKKISSDIDVSVNSVMKSVETSMMNNNREAAIKGKLIPSASKTIKMALVAGVAWAINPAIAVIGVLGSFACMKKMQKRERQLILDDIEVELKMCERYISKYESQNDLKKVREVEKIQRNLERQRQRIKYNMTVEYGSNSVVSSTTKPSDLLNN